MTAVMLACRISGTRSLQMLYRAVLFTFAPTALELVFVITLLATTFSPITAGLVAATFLMYVTWTLALTQVTRNGGLEAAKHSIRLDLGLW